MSNRRSRIYERQIGVELMTSTTTQDIAPAIFEAAAKQCGVAVETITPATHFQNDLNFDSLDVVEFTMAVEEALGVKIADDRIADLVTVQMVIDFVIEQKRAPVESRS